MGETSFDSPDTIKFVAFHLKTNVMLAIPRSKKKKNQKEKTVDFLSKITAKVETFGKCG